MKSLVRSLCFWLLVASVPPALTGCAGTGPRGPVQPGQAPLSRVTRSQIMATALRYAEHPWTPSAANVRHGVDAAGIQVDTPDFTYQKAGAVPGYWIPGREHRGMPYQWGGFSSPEEFDAGLARGLAAGDVYTDDKRRLLLDGVSAEAVGIDCSGFVSRCWNLPRAFSTRELANLCDQLPNWDALQPGDALNIYNTHVLIFSGWIGANRESLAAYETGGPPDWKVIRHVIGTDFLKRKGYVPLRYRGVVEG